MRIHVSQVSEEDGLKINYQFPEGQPGLKDEDSKVIGRPSVEGLVTREGQEARLKGNLEANVEIVCARCLAPIEVTVDENFDLFYIPSTDPRLANEERELGEEDLSVGVYQNDSIDLGDLVAELIELALPMARLCREDCRGLCAQCGLNLNEVQCSCSVEVSSPGQPVLGDWNPAAK
ncbi:MAG TPA: DUF177 domain-containing protein [Blastocatellia bacterium]